MSPDLGIGLLILHARGAAINSRASDARVLSMRDTANAATRYLASRRRRKRTPSGLRIDL
ncbi:hypothetical protein [Burkholderia sp. FL-7-2-10-S1-D7]|uniref:hypothetical protein n=1 Tax=Burkholderia sp. FL-7-2-10-S1-D7 TaxID=1637866 RepID=UPI000A556E17|nr:hypothetical protein [Burkholderia sp. FL-7-2-10-S1-D7]